MRRIITSILAAAIVAGGAVPASADKPTRGCPDGYTPMTIAQLVNLGEDPALLDTIDANNDQNLCSKDLPEPNGAGERNKIDNVANR